MSAPTGSVIVGGTKAGRFSPNRGRPRSSGDSANSTGLVSVSKSASAVISAEIALNSGSLGSKPWSAAGAGSRLGLSMSRTEGSAPIGSIPGPASTSISSTVATSARGAPWVGLSIARTAGSAPMDSTGEPDIGNGLVASGSVAASAGEGTASGVSNLVAGGTSLVIPDPVVMQPGPTTTTEAARRNAQARQIGPRERFSKSPGRSLITVSNRPEVWGRWITRRTHFYNRY